MAGLDKALSFANALFNALESAGHRVCLAPSGERFYRAHIDEHEEPKPRRQEYQDYGSHLWAPWRCTVVYVGTVPFGLAVIEMTESIVMRYVNGKYIRESDYKQPKGQRQEQEAQHARWLIEEDQRQIARSIKESREELDQVIKSWATAVGIEQFFKGVQERASELSEEQRKAVIDRLQLAREFIGTQDPLDFFNAWKAPNERYLPLAMRAPKATPVPAKD